MLGNFSFGDYFTLGIMTKELNSRVERVTSFQDDDEEMEFWKSRANPEWDSGAQSISGRWATSTLRPCTEIYYDQFEYGHAKSPGIDTGRYVEI
jgi:alanyl-tRNA synthetase